MEKNLGGQPMLFKTPEEFQKAIDAYFDSCQPVYFKDDEGQIATTNRGEPILIDMNPPTFNGLVLALGFASRGSFHAYLHYDGFSNIATRAKMRVASFAESKLYDNNLRPQGPMFALERLLSAADPAVTEETNQHKGLLAGLLGDNTPEETE